MNCIYSLRAVRQNTYRASLFFLRKLFSVKQGQWLLLSVVLSMMLWPFIALSSEQSVIAPYAHRSLMLDGVVLANSNLVAVGERGIILISTDHAESWVQAQVPTRATLTAVTFYDNQVGWAVGHDAVILRTRDGGATWELIHEAPNEERPLLDVWCSDEQKCYAIGAYGYFLETNDGGDSWQSRIISEDDWHLNQMKASDSGKLYIAAEAGAIYRSDDGGSTWKTLPSPYEGSFFGVLPLPGDTVLIFGLRGNMFRSEDAGNSWRKVQTGTEAMLNCGVRFVDGRVLIAGLAGTILISKDNGQSVTLFQQSNRLGISAACWVPDLALAIFGEGGARKIDVP
jgi:photosystem II stability/assembly factor-like uncharacterized protein